MRGGIAFAALALAACGADEPSPAEAEAEAQREIEMIREANDAEPPIRPVALEPILYPDIEKHDLFGQACAYAPGTSLGARVIARENDAFVKIDGEVVRLAADSGSRELPMRSRTLYTGREFSLRLAIVGQGGQQGASTSAEAAAGDGIGTDPATVLAGEGEYEGSVFLRDRWDRIVFEGTGTVQCSS